MISLRQHVRREALLFDTGCASTSQISKNKTRISVRIILLKCALPTRSALFVRSNAKPVSTAFVKTPNCGLEQVYKFSSPTR